MEKTYDCEISIKSGKFETDSYFIISPTGALKVIWQHFLRLNKNLFSDEEITLWNKLTYKIIEYQLPHNKSTDHYGKGGVNKDIKIPLTKTEMELIVKIEKLTK